MNIFDPDLSRRMAMAVQNMTMDQKNRFIEVVKKAPNEQSLPAVYRSYLKNGYKPDKVISQN